MSFVQEQVRHIDGQLEQLFLSNLDHHRLDQNVLPITHANAGFPAKGSPHTAHLQSLLRWTETDSSSVSGLTSSPRLTEVLRSIHASTLNQTESFDSSKGSFLESYDDQLGWYILGKCSSHTYGHALRDLFDQTISINQDLWYWNDVASSHRYIGLYSLQTSPIRLWNWITDFRDEIRSRGGKISEGWTQFYGHVRNIVRDRSFSEIRSQATVPLALVRGEVRNKILMLNRAKRVHTSAIGYLLSNGFSGEELSINDLPSTRLDDGRGQKWKTIVLRTVAVLDAVLGAVSESQLSQDNFEDVVKNIMAEDSLEDLDNSVVDREPLAQAKVSLARQSEVAERLERILSDRLPRFRHIYRTTQEKSSRPSKLVRYWLPATALLLSSGTILRILVRRRAAMLQWTQELGSTVIDFWANWVVEPTKKVIGTIRHDESSEVSIMSKRSLEGDRASLERMVVDFSIDNRGEATLTEAAIADIRSKVQEGDLTLVLMAYEKELKSPLYGSVRGNLIRTLLIQIQKTKVDVEVAMRGIDNLLKSQELVFGLLGLTPGVIVTVAFLRWFGSISSGRRMTQKGEQQSHAFEILRNIDRILTGSPQSDAGTLSYQEYGLLVCEATVLRELGLKALPKSIFREFLEDFNALIDNGSGVGRQIRVADRMRWAYSKWL